MPSLMALSCRHPHGRQLQPHREPFWPCEHLLETPTIVTIPVPAFKIEDNHSEVAHDVGRCGSSVPTVAALPGHAHPKTIEVNVLAPVRLYVNMDVGCRQREGSMEPLPAEAEAEGDSAQVCCLEHFQAGAWRQLQVLGGNCRHREVNDA